MIKIKIFFKSLWNKLLQAPSEYKFLYLVLIGAFLNDILWMLVIPYNRAPDEYLHLQMATFIFKHVRLPVYGIDLKPLLLKDQGIIISPYAHMPGLNYIFAAIGGWFLSFFFKNINILYVGRFFSVIFHLITIFLVFKIAEIVFPKNKLLKIFLPTIAAFIPQMTFVSSYVNIDSYTMMASTLLIYSLLFAKKRMFDLKSAVLVGISIGFVILGKYNGYVVIFLSFIFLLAYLRGDKRTVMKFLSLALIIPLLLSSWWFIRNAIIYNGDLFGFRVQNAEYLKLYNSLKDQGINVNNKIPLNKAVNADHFYVLSETEWIQDTFYSFWGSFGYMSIKMKNSYYQILIILTFLAIAGAMTAAQRSDKQKKRLISLSFIAVIAGLFMSLSLSLYADFQPQGRYLLPVISAFLILFGYGLFNIFTKTIYKKILLIFTLTFIIFLNITAFLNYIVPAYYINLDLNRATPLNPQPMLSLKNGTEISQSFVSANKGLSSIKIQFQGKYKSLGEQKRKKALEIIKLKSNGDNGSQINKLKKEIRQLNRGIIFAKEKSYAIVNLSIIPSLGGKPARNRKIVLNPTKNESFNWKFKPINYSKDKKFFFTIKASMTENFNLLLAGREYKEGKLFNNRVPTNKDILFNLFYSSSTKRASLNQLQKISTDIFLLFISVLTLGMAIVILAGILIIKEDLSKNNYFS